MDLPILTVDTAPPTSQPILEEIAADLGFVPNLAATIAASPTLLRAFDGLRRTVADESFDPRLRETAGVAVGVAVDNAYGVAFHSTVLGRLGVGEKDIDAMRQGAEPTGTAPAAVYAFARALVLDRGAVDPAVVQRALAAGLTSGRPAAGGGGVCLREPGRARGQPGRPCRARRVPTTPGLEVGPHGQARQVVTSITATGPAGICRRYCSYLAASRPRARSRSSPPSSTRPVPSRRTHHSLAQSSS